MNLGITKDLNKLKENDLYNIILFAIYKFTQNPQYSTISELIFTLDKDSLLKLCSTFGGCTITIPSIEEIKLFTNVLAMYQLIEEENLSYSEAYEKMGFDKSYKKPIAKMYTTLKEVIDNYVQGKYK